MKDVTCCNMCVYGLLDIINFCTSGLRVWVTHQEITSAILQAEKFKLSFTNFIVYVISIHLL